MADDRTTKYDRQLRYARAEQPTAEDAAKDAARGTPIH